MFSLLCVSPVFVAHGKTTDRTLFAAVVLGETKQNRKI